MRSKAWQNGFVSGAEGSESLVSGSPGCRCGSPVVGFSPLFLL